ncbi:DUF2793 domain-containing protein, partial [Afifella sp. IM 167]|uniref:DUF2793 domain-containing protein n=1 Tax=Afifella sp. IM 167 TaxID=2033586 RepID=UPI001CC9D0B0
GDWAGREGELAVFETGAWRFFAPFAGLTVWVEDEAALLVWRGGGWSDVAPRLDEETLQNLPLLGVGAEADATNRLAVRSAAVLFTHAEAGGVQVKLNKEAAGDTASFLFQTGYGGRAEIGLVGGDDFSFKVSPDGASFYEGITITAADGQVSFTRAPKFAATINYDQYCPADAWTVIGMNEAEHNDQLAFDAATNRFTAPAAGFYLIGGKYLFKANGTEPGSIAIGFGRNGADPAGGSEICQAHGPIASLVSSVQHQHLFRLSAGETIDLRARMSGHDGYAQSGAASFWGFRVA